MSTSKLQDLAHDEPSSDRLAYRKTTGDPAAIVFDLLNPVPYGFFIGALVFDAVYAINADVLWFKAAAWLIAIGLVVAVIPRLIDLYRVWFRRSPTGIHRGRTAFWFYLLAVGVAIVNAFVHSRDAYAIVPQGVVLSILTVALLVVANVFTTLHPSNIHHEGRA